MRVYMLTLCLLITNCLYSQKIEKCYDLKWKECDAGNASYFSIVQQTDSGWYQRDYYVQARRLQMTGLYLDSLGKRKNGHFVYYYPNGKINQTGNYVNEKKEGSWLFYHRNGQIARLASYKDGDMIGTNLSWSDEGRLTDSTVLNEDGVGASIYWYADGTLSASGNYSKGHKQDGVWVYYHQNGKKSSVENYDKGNLVSCQYSDENGQAISDTANTEKDASFTGGSWSQYLSTRLRMPQGYKIENSDRATILVNFIIDRNGNVEDAFVDMGFHPVFDKIALEVIKNSPKWRPATDKHNRKVKAYRRQPVTFAQIKAN